MAGVISTGNHPKALWPGVDKFYGRAYDRHEKYCEKMFEIRSSSKAYEEMVELEGFGLAPKKAQGAPVNYDSEVQGPVTRFTHNVYSLGYIVTKEEQDDNQYMEVSKGRAEALAFSMYTTKEVVAANIYNRAFDSSYVGGNGVEMISTAQVTSDGTQSNHITTAADLSEASLEDLLVQIATATNTRGLEVNIKGQQLIVPPALEFEANRILFSTLQAGTANNDINAVRSMGLLPQGILANPYLTDTDAWFVRTNIPHGTILYMRTPMSFTRDNDFDTDNAKAKASERYTLGWSNWRGVYGSPGV